MLTLILSEKAAINLQENPAGSKPLEEFIRQFTGSSGNGDASKKSAAATAEKTTTASR